MVNAGDPDGDGYTFADIRASDVEGMVWEDYNNDGEVNFGEKVIENVTITLTGTDDRGHSFSASALERYGRHLHVHRPAPSDAFGYTITETQPAEFIDGEDVLGTVNGVVTGDNSVNDVFSDVVLPAPGSLGENHNFGDARRPAAG